MNFLHKTPMLRLCAALILGILIAQICTHAIIAITCIFAALTLIYYEKSIFKANSLDKNYHSGIAIILTFTAIGFSLTATQDKHTHVNPPTGVSYKANILKTPEIKAKSIMAWAEIISAKGERFNTILYLQKDSTAFKLQKYDTLLVRINKFFNCDYAYFNRMGIYYTAYVQSKNYSQINTLRPPPTLLERANNYRDKLLKIYQEKGIKNEAYNLISALSLGYKKQIDKETKLAFAQSGASHILAVSGLHVGIIYMAFNFLFGFLERTRKTLIIKQLCLIVTLWMYAYLCALPPSVVRSALMFSLISASAIFNAKSTSMNAVFFSAFCMLIYKPDYLFDVGFQLSYSAVIAILMLYDKLNNLYKSKYYIFRWLWSLTSVSIAAQIGTLPFTLYYFNQFAVYFLISNIIVIPLASVLIYCSIALLTLSSFDFSKYIALGINYIADFLIDSTKFISSLPYACIQNIEIEIWHIFAMITIAIYVYLFFKNKDLKYFLISAICICISICIGIFNDLIILFNLDKL